MSTLDNAPEVPLDARPKKTSSTAAKLVQAAALAAVLVPLGSVAMEADTITCGFSGYNTEGSANQGGYGCSNINGDHQRFNFGEYYFDLQFNGMDGDADFDVSITDNVLTTEEFESRAESFPGYACIPLTEGGPCIDFVVEFIPSYPSPREWLSYDFEIHWTWDSENNGYSGGPDGSLVSVLHDRGDSPDNAYDEDMCIAYSETHPCEYDSDPGIRSGDTDFRSFTPVVTSVPEPSTMILLVTGLGSVLVSRRRNRVR